MKVEVIKSTCGFPKDENDVNILFVGASITRVEDIHGFYTFTRVDGLERIEPHKNGLAEFINKCHENEVDYYLFNPDAENLEISFDHEDDEVKYLDCTPTWSDVWWIYALAYANGDTYAGRKAAEQELGRMASMADKWVELQKAKKDGQETKTDKES